jgi:hypothetical protein
MSIARRAKAATGFGYSTLTTLPPMPPHPGLIQVHHLPQYLFPNHPEVSKHVFSRFDIRLKLRLEVKNIWSVSASSPQATETDSL